MIESINYSSYYVLVIKIDQLSKMAKLYLIKQAEYLLRKAYTKFKNKIFIITRIIISIDFPIVNFLGQN